MTPQKLLLLSCACTSSLWASQAVITHKVLDLNRHTPHDAATYDYPASPDTQKCHRDHQALYNEEVRVSESLGNAIKLECDNLIYDFDAAGQPLTTLWTYRSYVMMHEELAAKGLLAALPCPVYGQEPTIVLTYPWNDFSVGTRFRRTPEADTANTYAIVRIDYAQSIIVHDFVPVDRARIEVKPENHQQARQAFVCIINEFLDRVEQEGVVPFVWGGSSFVRPYDKNEPFYQQDGLWHRKNSAGAQYYGYDASEFIWRMARIAGLNFPCKTTWTMEQTLHKLGPDDIIEDGDLIWTKGGIMTISSVERNEIICAPGYSSGYGRVLKMPLGQCIQGISTYAELLATLKARKPLFILDKEGKVIKTCDEYKILKLVS